MRRSLSFFLLFLFFFSLLPHLGEAHVLKPCQIDCYQHKQECYESNRPPSGEYLIVIPPANVFGGGHWGMNIHGCGINRTDTECHLTGWNLTQEYVDTLRIPACEMFQECLRECGPPQVSLRGSCTKGCYSWAYYAYIKQNWTYIKEKCVPYGFRIFEEMNFENRLYWYCSTEGMLEQQKESGEPAHDDYECRSNSARYGVCEDIAEQVNILQKIFGWLARLFS